MPKRALIGLRPRTDTLHVSQDRTVLATRPDGFFNGEPEKGLFVHQTRLLSRYEIFVDGQKPIPITLSNVHQHSWLGYYIYKTERHRNQAEVDRGSGQVPPETQQTLELKIARFVGTGVHEDIDLTNFTEQDLSFELAIALDADFADSYETIAGRLQNGHLEKRWDPETRCLRFDYSCEHQYKNQSEEGRASITRALSISFDNLCGEPKFEKELIRFRVNLKALESWHVCLKMVPEIEDQTLSFLYGCYSFAPRENDYDKKRESFLHSSTQFRTHTSNSLSNTVTSALEQAKFDLASLRLHDFDDEAGTWTVSAGLPIYVALFGRDTLTTAWQSGLLGPEAMEGTLKILARFQGQVVNDWRDEQPGKMLHEAHTGPVSMLNFFPRARYYGSITTSFFYPFSVCALWHWTGDKDRVRKYLEPALRSFKWADEYGDLDGDGFYEYLSRSTAGTRHQGWKDSSDAVVYSNGKDVEPPIAMSEEQGFAYLSKFHMSELLWWLDEKDLAKKFYRQARELKKRFNDSFWMPDEGFYAMALDKDKNQVTSIGSDALHCLATGIIDNDRAQVVADRLMKPDLFSGWGIRTLSSDHPLYNPYSYHRGTVWPVENATAAVGFMRYGFHEHAERLCKAAFEACSLFQHCRLPELFSGHARDERHPFPAVYPRANSPQAWSSSAIFSFVQALLGLYPYAPLNTLVIDPHLPVWLPEIELHGLRVGRAVVSIRFFREKSGKSTYQVLDQRGPLHVVKQPSPWSETAGTWERVRDFFQSEI